MDDAYLYMLAAVGAGGALGLFLPIKLLVLLVVGAVGLLVAGFACAALFGWETGGWLFGLALMIAPVYGGLLFAAAAASHRLRRARARRGPVPGSDDAA